MNSIEYSKVKCPFEDFKKLLRQMDEVLDIVHVILKFRYKNVGSLHPAIQMLIAKYDMFTIRDKDILL